MEAETVPASYQPGAFFREWAHETAMDGRPSVRAWLIEKREALLERIDFEVWNAEQSKRLTLLDYLTDT